MTMPTTDAILSSLAAVTNEWRWLAIAWHAVVAGVVLAAVKVRLTERSAALLLVMPLISVGTLAWWGGNPFNALAFLLLVLLMAGIAATQLSNQALTFATPGFVATGVGLVAFGLVYPHFLVADSWITDAYAAPFGLIPCPTLAVLTGFSLIVALHSRAWYAMLAGAALFYGVVGVGVLGVWIDAALMAGGAVLVARATRRSHRALVFRDRLRRDLHRGAAA